MRFAKSLAIAVVGLAVLCGSVGASGLEALGVGTKAIGMGGAFRATADDWTAAWYNPAGYAQLWDNQLGANLSLVHYRNEITPDYRWGGVYESGMINDVPGFNHHAYLSNPSGGFLVRLPVWGETVFGLSAYQPFDYNVEWQLYEQPRAYNDVFKPSDKQFLNNFDVVAFQFTAAREFIEEKLFLGLGISVLRADLFHNNIYLRNNPYLDIDPNWAYADRPFDKIVNWAKDDGYGFGAGFNLGMLWQKSEKLRVGARVFVPTNITASGETVLEYYMPRLWYPNEDADETGGVAMLLKSGMVVVDSADFEATIKLPPVIGAGISYQTNERLTLSLDAEYTMWSRFDGYNFSYSNHKLFSDAVFQLNALQDSMMVSFLTSDLSRSVDWSNTLKAMVGAQYIYNEYVTLMAGGGIDQSPVGSDELHTPQIIDLGTKVNLSGGLIVHLQHWDVGFVTSYVGHPEASTTSLIDLDGDGNMDSFTGDYKAATYQTAFSFNYRF